MEGGSIISKILVGFDGSEDSEQAVRLATDLALKYGASVVICHAFGHTPTTTKPAEVHRMVDPVLKQLARHGVVAEAALPDELPAQGILDAAEEHQVDLIAIGRKGRGVFANLLMGSTTERVLRFAKVPVLVAH